jgi:Na+-translocating ferredoxin:NAD+ oxidoreductase RnfG subunit
MEWTEREIQIAKSLQEKNTQSFLKKVFTQIQTNNGEVLEKNVVALDDAEYGRLMKVHYLSKQENLAKLNLIAKIAKSGASGKKMGAIAPK